MYISPNKETFQYFIFLFYMVKNFIPENENQPKKLVQTTLTLRKHTLMTVFLMLSSKPVLLFFAPILGKLFRLWQSVTFRSPGSYTHHPMRNKTSEPPPCFPVSLISVLSKSLELPEIEKFENILTLMSCFLSSIWIN